MVRINDYIYIDSNIDNRLIKFTLNALESKFYLIHSIPAFIINRKLYFLAYDISEVVKEATKKSETELFKDVSVLSVDKHVLQLSSFEYNEYNTVLNIISRYDTYKVFYNAISDQYQNNDDISIFNAWFNYNMDRITQELVMLSEIANNLRSK